MQSVEQIYEDVILRRPVATLVAVGLITLGLGWFTQYFTLDASADSLTLERDEGLEYYRYVRARYGSDDFLLVTYTPREPLFDNSVLADLASLRDDLTALQNVQSVTTILDVPLVMSPPVSLRSIDSGIRYLRDGDTDRQLAQQELLGSPLYKDMLISSNGLTTALRIDMQRDAEHVAMREQRDALREKQYSEGLTAAENAALSDVSNRYDDRTRELLDARSGVIAGVRQVLEQHRDVADMHLGGVPMIVADSMDFIRRDLVTFGAGVFAILIIILATAFQKRRWVILPLLTCALTCIAMIGLLGLVGWRVTVVSSNFVALLLILGLALTLHIIVRYREIHERSPGAKQIELVMATVRRIFVPCLYTALTTVVAFGSLIVSGIRPVIDFGWMMSIGIVVAFLFSFTFFPAALMLLRPGKPSSRNDITAVITGLIAELIRRRSKHTILLFGVLAIIGIAGLTQLTVENRFIDYYKETTEIYRGMELIDSQLGGTTPLDIIIDAPVAAVAELPSDNSADYEEEFEDIYADETDSEAGITSRSYWFNSLHLADIEKLHAFVDELPDTGKVISVATFIKILEQIDAEIVSDNFTLSIVHEKLPQDVRDALLSPFLSENGDQLRISVRVFESDRALRRTELIDNIQQNLGKQIGLDPSNVHLSGMLVLYNNMLQSLFRSQLLTLGAVFVAIMLMFLVLFRSLKIAVMAIIPNLTSACLVLGLMGWFGIPLDLMTITIAAIAVGIGVDDTIHYVHRFRHEFEIDRDYWAAVFRCHRSIGRAIYYTSLAIMLGFSVLAFSRFVPTMYFGLLTSLAMLVSLLANMTLLPVLLVAFKTAGEPAISPAQTET